MKILAFTDIHNQKHWMNKLILKAKKEKPDVVVCCGDISIFGHGIKNVLRRLNALKTPVLIIHGNHEIVEDFTNTANIFKNIHFIHKKKFVISNAVFIGYGGGGFDYKDKKLEAMAKKHKDYLKKHKSLTRVFLSHAPPFNTRLDKVDKLHYGSKSVRDFISKLKIDYAFSGHFHENFNKKDKIGTCIVINPGPEGLIVNISA